MKPYHLYVYFLLATIIGGCASSYNYSSGVYDDDLYYNSKDKPVSVAESYSALPAPDKNLQKEDNKIFAQQQSAYNNSERADAQEDLRDFTDIQNEYAAIINDETVEDVDTLLYYDDNTGYWVNDFQGSEQDKDYAERIARFHGPMQGIPYWSPLYNDVIFNSGFNYNVYVDGDYAYVVPDWTSPYYNNWRYGPSYRWGWGSGWGYPGYGYGWNSWYGMGWNSCYGSGWGHPGYAWGGYPGYGWGHPHHPPVWGGSPSVARERGNRVSTAGIHGSRVASTTSTRGNRVSSATNRSNNTIATRQSRETTTKSTRQAGTSTNVTRQTRASYNNNKAAVNKNTRPTRSSYTPTYTRTTPSNRSTRSNYNSNSNASKTKYQSTSGSNNNRSSRQSSNSYNSGSSRNREYTPPTRTTRSSTSGSNYSSPSRSSSSSYSSPSKSSSGGSRSSGGSSSGGRQSR